MEGWKSPGSVKFHKHSFEIGIKFSPVKLETSYYFLPVPPLMYLAGYFTEYLMILASMLLHETGHLAAALLTRKRVRRLRILPAGISISLEEHSCNKWESMALYLSGPAVNVLLFVLGYIIYNYYPVQSQYVHFFMLTNVYLSIFNLIPVAPLDGGEIVGRFFSMKYGLFMADRYRKRITLGLTILIFVAGIIQLVLSLHNFSLLFIGVYLFTAIKAEHMEAALMNIKQIVYRKSRILKKGIYAARDLVVIESTRLSESLKSMDFDRFHIIHVLNEDLQVVRVFSEHEVIEAMLKNGCDLTFGELVKIVEKCDSG
jgi:stage IV sporulation protein FB